MSDRWSGPPARRRVSALASSTRAAVRVRAALDDLLAIDASLDEQVSPATALALVIAIRRRADCLRAFPYGGRRHRRDARVLRVPGTPYLIHDRLAARRCEVLRVHHEREDGREDDTGFRPAPSRGDQAGLT